MNIEYAKVRSFQEETEDLKNKYFKIKQNRENLQHMLKNVKEEDCIDIVSLNEFISVTNRCIDALKHKEEQYERELIKNLLQCFNNHKKLLAKYEELNITLMRHDRIMEELKSEKRDIERRFNDLYSSTKI